MSRRVLLERNPLAVDGTAMPRSLLLMVKVLVVVFFASGEWLEVPDHFDPFFSFFVHVGSPATFHHVLEALAVVGGLAILLNVRVRAASLLMGLVIAVSILASRPYYENNRTYVACLFLLAALSARDGRRSLVQYQVIVLYFAAALNKLLSADWQNGDFFSTWAHLSPHWYGTYHAVDSLLPGMLVPIAFSWIAIVTEFVLVAAFAVRRLHPFAIWLGIAYHTGLFMFTTRTFGMFWFAIPASYLAFVVLPARVDVRAGPGLLGALARALARVDADGAAVVRPSAGGEPVAVTINATTYGGLDGVLRLALCSPAVYLAFVLVAAGHAGRWAGLVVIAVLAAVAVSWLARRLSVQNERRRAARAAW